jgi:hypothetical protein
LTENHFASNKEPNGVSLLSVTIKAPLTPCVDGASVMVVVEMEKERHRRGVCSHSTKRLVEFGSAEKMPEETHDDVHPRHS